MFAVYRQKTESKPLRINIYYKYIYSLSEIESLMLKHFASKKSDQHTAVTVVADFNVDFSRPDKWLIQFIQFIRKPAFLALCMEPSLILAQSFTSVY